MRDETLRQLLWLAVISCWVAGFVLSRWGRLPGFFTEVGQTIGPPLAEPSAAWKPLIYFPLTVVASFVLTQLFFGGGVFFVLLRGAWDAAVLRELEAAAGSIDLLSFQQGQVWVIFYYLTILGCNVPLCLWASQIGAFHSLKTLERLRGRLVRPSEEVRSHMIKLLAISIGLAVVASIALSYA
jgi:hypothetical protein